MDFRCGVLWFVHTFNSYEIKEGTYDIENDQNGTLLLLLHSYSVGICNVENLFFKHLFTISRVSSKLSAKISTIYSSVQ